jgi:hypothetical protein
MKSSAVRLIIIVTASLIVAGVVYVPVRLMPDLKRLPPRDEVSSRRIDRALQERRFRDRQPTVFLGLRLIVNQLAGIVVVALVGRKVLRLSLRR